MSDEPNSPRDAAPLGDQGESGSLVAFPRARQRPPDNLPLQLTSFVGREKEVAEVKRLLEGTRLLTLRGPGGCGKTRLALAVARDLVEAFEDGVWWVELASLSDPKLVPGALASALSVREAPDRSLTEVLVERLKPAKTLLVLDNCEHLVEGCAVLADALLRACPELEILASSREPLRIAGESTWVVPSLSLPDPRRLPPTGELTRYEAVRLFVERAGAVDAGFELTERNGSAVARLCRKLDGIPLAIELAAARTRALTVEQISEKLEDSLSLLTTGSRTAAPRHQTLKAALQWSYELLGEQEQELLGRLSVFAGGWDLEAAEAVGAGGPVKAGLVLDLLSTLVDKSLVVAEESGEEGPSYARYRMLEPVRQYAREKLEESTGAPEVRRRHAEHYLALAETAEPELLGADQGLWLLRLRTESGNLREALSWSLDTGQEERAQELRLRLVAALGRFWGREGFEEGKWWLRMALDRDRGGFPVARAKALGELGFILLFQQAYRPAVAALDESVALYKELGDRSGAAFALANLGWAVLHGYYRERILAFVRESEALIEGGLEDHPRAYLSIVLAAATVWQGDLDLATSRIKEAVALCRELGNLRDVEMALFNLGGIEFRRGDTDRAAKVFEEGAIISGQLGDLLGAAYYIWIFGGVNARLGRPVRAARLWGAAEALREQMGMSFSRYDLAESGYEGDLASVRSMLDEASFDAAWAEGRAMSPEQAIGYALEETKPPDEEIPADRPPPVQPSVERLAEDAGGDRRHNLPVAQSGFVGREREMPEVERTLSVTQLLTLTGAGGCGKTRLALEVARDLVDDYPDGVWMVELASLTDGELVPQAVAAALGVREQPDLAFTDTLVGFLRPRRTLLVLDNCEHLIEACARLVDTLLSSCEHLRILATSREALGGAGEVNWMVPSLTVPDAGRLPDLQNLARYEAVQLFVERARSRLPAFELTPENVPAVVNICRKLDGIPLAIELATARMGALTVEQIAERLKDSIGFLTTGDRTRAPRQRTLRATLSWSHELLSEPEQKLFGRLSVFAGGWTLEAAEAVGAGEPVETGQVLDLLSTLVGKSLVVAEESGEEGPSYVRYRMLEPVRQYGRERLQESGEDGLVRERHAEYYLRLAEEAEPELREQGAWLERLGSERGNFRAALGWMLDPQDVQEEPAEERAQLGLRLTAALAQGRFWAAYGVSEGLGWLEKGLAKSSTSPSSVRAKALNEAGWIATYQGDYQKAAASLEEGLSIFKEIKDKPGTAVSLTYLGHLMVHGGDHGRVEALGEEAEALREELVDQRALASLLTFLGMAALDVDDHERMVALLEEGLALNRELGEMRGVALCLNVMGLAALERGDIERAAALLEENLLVLRELRDKVGTVYGLLGSAGVAGSRGEPARAARLWGAAEALREVIGLPLSPFTLAHYDYEDLMATARSRLDEATWAAAWSEGRAMTPEQAIEHALVEPVPEPPPAEPVRSIGAGPAEVKDHPEQLRVFALGPTRVEKHGRPLASSPDWSQKPRELLFYLLSHPKGRTKEQIGLALWPEASTAQLRSSFHDTAYRLRRALGGKEWIVFQKGRYAFDRSLDYSYDIEAFEEHLSEAQRVKDQAPEQAVRHLQKAISLYGGDFLEDLAVDGEWAMDRQEELGREHQEALLLLGGLLFAQERHAEAAEAYRKAITHDGFLEEAHRELMRCLATLGERGQALRHYEDLVELLDERLDTSPAPETSALYESLRTGSLRSRE